jgi:hypothetical protein
MSDSKPLPNTPPAHAAAGRAPEDMPPATPKSGTHILPMPDTAPTVAGMPRQTRIQTAPGDPGVPAPEDQVNGGTPPDTRPRR